MYKDPALEQVCQQFTFPLACTILDQPKAVLPNSIENNADLYGSLGSRYSRVDRSARVGYKPSDKSYWIGQKDHVSIDGGSGLPVYISVTPANVHDTTQYVPSLKAIQQLYGDLVTVNESLADRGYDSERNRDACRDILGAEPRIINRNASTCEKEIHRIWSSIRQAVERCIGQARMASRKNYPRVRGKKKVTVWVKMAYLIVLIIGLMLYLNGEPELVNHVAIYK